MCKVICDFPTFLAIARWVIRLKISFFVKIVAKGVSVDILSGVNYRKQLKRILDERQERF
jgi:hypothetical protein